MKSKLSFLFSLLIVSAVFAQEPAPPNVTQWPLRVDGPDGTVTLYEPQPEKFEGDTLTARAAVSLTPPGATDPEFGAVWFQANVATDRDARITTIQNITVKRVKLPNAAADQETRFGQVLTQQIPSMNVILGLDQLEATLGVVQKAKEESQQLQNTPPKIVFTTTPTTLVLLDGPPKLQPAAVQGVMSVVNTPFILLLDMGTKTYFLKTGPSWMSAPDVTGPWQNAGTSVPAGIADAGNKLSAANTTADTSGTPAGPTAILVAEEPTEVISSQGPPTYTPLPGNDLLYMSNTDSDVFMDVSSQQYYVLLSGRWFTGPGTQGPWSFVGSDKLPPAFAQIPADSPKARVLASVAGTQNSKDARLDAYIPQTTAIRRDSGAALTVSYDGAPQFVPVENTPITYASNCADPVLFVDNGYYCCHQAVWYRGTAAIGPWEVCTAVPQVIYTLPPSCPVYNCRYCYVYDSTPDVVYCGYLPGYTGCYVYGSTIVYGTGYRYPYWYHDQFIPRPYTWGFAPRYDYYAGTWAFGVSVAVGPTWFADRPHEHNWFGPQGYVDYRQVQQRYDRAPGVRVENVHNVTINRINIYNRTENIKRNVTVRDTRTVVQNREPARQSAPVRENARPAENNVYVDRDGGVFRRTSTGWESHDAKGWTATKTVPGATADLHESVRTEKLPQHDTPAHDTPARDTPARDTPAHDTPAHDTPAHDTPARETPSHDTPARTQTPAREAPVHSEPAHVEPARAEPNRGLDEDRAARERGSARPAEETPAHQAPAEHQSANENSHPANNPGNKPK